MRAVLILLTVVAFLPLGLSAAAGQTAESGRGDIAPTACDTAAAGRAPDPSSPLLATSADGLPAELGVVALADQLTEQWPRAGRGLILTLRRVILDPDVASEPRISEGPLLFFVESGQIGISISSRMAPYESGAAVLVQSGQRYALRNLSPAPASVLRVQIVRPGDETSVAWGDPVQVSVEEHASTPGPPFIATLLLLRGEIPPIAGRTHLILGCLSWSDPAADSGAIVHPGPVGFVVVRGQLLVGEAGRRDAGDCVVFQAGEPHRFRAGSSPPVVLFAGAIPDGASWSSAAAEEGSRATNTLLGVECGAYVDATARDIGQGRIQS
jgi:mannose-6-phosphate isomerase-like protein (cupin superfamily)